MANVFLVTYGGRANNGNTYVPYKAIVHTADEAIAVINTWQTYGGKRDYASPIMVNATTEQKIRNLFRDGLGSYPSGAARTCETMRTTGCGCWDITFYLALADTLEEHERIYNEIRERNKQERIRQAEAARQRRLAELNEHRRGWYHVSLEMRLYVFANRGNDWMENADYSCNLIADSGMDAYDKVVKYVKDHPQELTVRGNITGLQSYCGPTDGGFKCTFLGVKTDDGYSVEKWEEWKKNGEI